MIVIMYAELSRIFETARERHIGTGQTLFVTGDEVQSVYLVRSGRVLLKRHSPYGQSLILTAATSGDVLAEASVYSKHYHCDAVASEPSSLAILQMAAFREAIHADRELSECWASMLASRLQSARTKAEIRTLGKVANRLDTWLASGNKLPRRGMLQNVAAEIGVSREALYRELAKRRSP